MSLEHQGRNTACDNEKCVSKRECKRYIMWKQYKADDIQRGGGTKFKPCKRFLPMRNVG